MLKLQRLNLIFESLNHIDQDKKDALQEDADINCLFMNTELVDIDGVW